MSDLSFWNILLALVGGYLIGSFPTGVIIARLMGGEDPRRVGSGHTGGTNMVRSNGWAAGIITGAVDIGKGPLAVWLMLQFIPNPWVIPLTGTTAVIGHCWPIYTAYRGGMGLAPAAGLAGWFFPLAIIPFAAFYLLLNRLLRHPARAVMLVSAMLPFILLALRVDPVRLALGIGISFALIVRFASDFFRVYPD